MIEMTDENEITTIRISKGTVNKLRWMGKKGETYEEIILDLMAAGRPRTEVEA